MSVFSENPSMQIRLANINEKDFRLTTIGYDDFKDRGSLKTTREQDFHTIHLIFNGNGIVNIEDRTYQAKKHDMFYTPPNVKLSYYPEDGENWDYIWFAFEGKNAEKYVKLMGFDTDKEVIPCRNFNDSYYIIRNFFENTFHEQTARYYDALSLFYKFLDINSNDESTIENHFSKTAQTYIKNHYYEPTLTINDICYDLGVSHSYMCKLFKNETGKSLVDYLIDVRINNACRLLETSSLSVSEIAFSVGFNSDVHFMKTFKRRMGVTPTQYRKQNRE